MNPAIARRETLLPRPYSPENRKCVRLSGGHGLGHKALQGKLLLLQVFSRGVLDLQLAHSVAERLLDSLLLAALELQRHCGVGDDLLNTADVRLELLLSLEALAESVIGGLELLGLVDHVLNLSRRELTNGVGNGDVGAAAGSLLSGGDLQDTVDIDLEDNLENGLTGAHGGDGSQSELSEGGVVLTVDTLTLVDGELNGLLVVGNSGEGSLLDGRNGLATADNGGEDVALHGDTKGQGNDIQKKEVRGIGGSSLAGEDTGLDGGTVGNSLIGVDALLELLAVEVVGQQLLDLGDTGRTTDEDNLVNSALLAGSVLEDLGDGLESTAEGLGVQLLETSTGDLKEEIIAIEQRVDLNGGLSTAGEGTLGTLASSSETAQGTGILGDV